MLGWLNFLSIFISLFTLTSVIGSFVLLFEISFIATFAFVIECSATIYSLHSTLPNDPDPRVFRMV
jgi:hypothetical protein